MERQIQVLVFTADVRVQVPPRPPKIKGHPNGCPFIFYCVRFERAALIRRLVLACENVIAAIWMVISIYCVVFFALLCGKIIPQGGF